MKKASKIFLTILICCIIITIMVFVAPLVIVLDSFLGYNGYIREYLSDINNYITYECVFVDFVYDDQFDYMFIEFEDDSILERYSSFQSRYTFREQYNKDVLCVQILDENTNILDENGFFNDVKSNCKLEIRSTSTIYMDNPLYYVISVKINGKVYLSDNDGFNNVIRHVEKEKSHFI